MKSAKVLLSAAMTVATTATVFFLAPSRAVAHHAVLQFNLEEMISTADRVFLGRCVGVRETEEMIAGGLLPVTIYTFDVSDILKGEVPRTFTFRQLGWRAKSPKGKRGEALMHGKVADARSAMVHGLSHYAVGEQLLLMLIPNYLQGKVTYPVGLYQGAFYIQQNSLGERQLRNSINNQGLFTHPYNGFSKSSAKARFIKPGARENPIERMSFRGVPASQLLAKRGALPAEPFIELVREMARAE